MKRTGMIAAILCVTLSVMAQNQKGAATYAARLTKFVDGLTVKDSLSTTEKAQVDSTYHAFLTEYKVVRDSLSDEDIRQCSKEKLVYQKEKTRLFINKTSDNVADTAEGIGKKVSKAFKRTKKKFQGAVDAFKKN